jgi:2-polyprenyl-3-methyl-5-hydroxy-6-metoxy-1,4-benzoquinol methylase
MTGGSAETGERVESERRAPHGELTDPAYWDGVWAETASVGRLSPLDPQFGREGAFMRMVRRQVGDLSGQRVLEVGAGGANYRLLALNRWGGAQVTGVDHSEVGLALLTEVFRINGAETKIVRGDVLHTTLPRADFDLVVHWGVLEHFSDPVPILRACCAALRPGGRLLFSTPNMEAWAAWGWAHLSPRNWSRHVLHDEAALRRACATAGLEFEHGFYFGGVAVQMAASERGGRIPALLSFTQRAVRYASRRFGVVIDSRHLSQHRGVLARKTLARSSQSRSR